MIPWLCTSIASALRIRPRGERSSGKSPRRAPPRNYMTRKICKNCSRTLVSIGFVCYLLSCCVAFFNRECVGETRRVSKGFPPGKELENTSREIASARRQFPWCYHYKTLLWTHVREDKELNEKVKEEGRTCQELLRRWKKAVFERKRKLLLQKPKTRN
jgi:hypothetical protein